MTITTSSTILSREELRQVTGYQQANKQLVELLRQGFYRARRSPVDGYVILERAHYDAICSGGGRPANDPVMRLPKVRTR